jgi:hypothetical protein
MRRHLTYANLTSTLCLVLVLGGTAYATHPGGTNTISSGDIINGEVRSVDIATNAVTTADIAANAVTSAKIADGSVTGADVANNSIASADVANNSIAGADVASNTLDGLDIVEGSLVLDPHFSAAAAPQSSCTDDSHTGAVCGTTTINLERSGRVLMNAAGNWRTTALNDTSPPGENNDNSTAVAGSCVLRIDGSSISTPVRMGELAPSPGTQAHSDPFDGTFALTDLTAPLPSGTHTVDVFCVEVDGDIDWRNIRLTAARVDN